MQFHHQWIDTIEAQCGLATRITYIFRGEVLFTITITWFPQVTLLEEPCDMYWFWTPYYTAEVD